MVQETVDTSYFCINNPNTKKRRIYNVMKIQTKKKQVHVILAMQKASLSILSLNQQLIKESALFPNMHKNISVTSREKKNKENVPLRLYYSMFY